MTTPTVPGGLVDTDILVDAQRRWPAAAVFLTSLGPGGATASSVSAMELVVGCRNAAELARLKRFLRRFLVLPVSDPVSHRAYSLMQSFTLSHGLLMAATALEHGLPLYTRNVRHFHMITGLPVIRPY